jgi:DNA invertase Pin-like site-specific DNA recombinase
MVSKQPRQRPTQTRTPRVGSPAPSDSSADSQARAVIYLRVSTKDQAERGGESEGFSLPAQREACTRKAVSVGAVVVEEFVDRGESAKTADRPELQRMLQYIKDQPVSYVICHKVDRLARNRLDDSLISMAIRETGATLVTAPRTSTRHRAAYCCTAS